MSGKLPAGWEEKKLGEVCIIKPPKSEARKQLRPTDKVSFVPMEDLGIDRKIVIPKHERALSDVEGSYTYFAENDVLLAKITPCFENGKLGIARNLKNGIGFGSSEYIVFRSAGVLLSEFLYYFLNRDSFRQNGIKTMSGAVGHKRVSKSFVEDAFIPLPPLPEQKRIVAILDEAFAAIAKAKENAEKNLADARELFESYLEGVFKRGSRGGAENAEWQEKKLDEISENLDSKRVPITKNVRSVGNIPYYGASGIVDYVEDYLFDENLLCVSEDGANLLARTYPIAFSISGKTWVNNHAHVLRFKHFESQKYVEYYLNIIKIEAYVSGMAQPKLNQAMLNQIPIPFPPLPEQRRIVERLDALSAETKRLEEIYRRKIADLDELKKAILERAFKGEL